MPKGPLYRMRVYDYDDATVLTPVAGAPHSDVFAVTSGPEHTDTILFRPYLEGVKGRRGQINLFSRTNDTGIGAVRLLDKRTTVGGSNLSRWVTAFLGDTEKKQRLIGKKFFIEESIDGGTAWSAYYTGFFSKLRWGPDKIWLSVGLRDTKHIMKQEVFNQLPHASVTKAYRPSILPIGIIRDSNPAQLFGNKATVNQITATVDEVGFGYMILKDFTGVDMIRRGASTSLEQLWEEIGHRTPKFGIADASFPQVMRCNIRRTSPSAIDDDFTVTAFKTLTNPGRGTVVVKVQVTSLMNRQDPKAGYVGDFAADQTVTFHVFPDVDTPISEEFPIFVDDMNHKEVLRDLLDGKYGKLNSDGTVRWSVPYNATDLVNDDTRPEARGVITEAEDLDKVITNWCQQYNYAYRTDEIGEVRLISTKPPDGTLSPPTITDADLIDGGSPSWEVNDDSVVNEFETRMYWDTHADDFALGVGLKDDLTIPAGGVTFAPIKFRAVGGFSDHKPKAKKIDGSWLHGNNYELIFDTTESIFKRAWIEGLGQEMLGPFGRGVHRITLRCRRRTSGGNPEGCVEGDWRVIDVDAIPDPGTNLRGGTRLGRCISRYNDGPAVVLTFIDMGEDLQLNVPTFTSVAQIAGATTYAQRLALLQNVENDPIRIELSVTGTGIGTRPTTGWHYGGMATADGNFDVSILPANRRVWWRIRSEVTDGNRLKVPSDWVYPTTPAAGYVDTAGLGTPSGLSDSVDGTLATLTWTNPSTDYRVQVMVALDGQTLEVIATLPAGSTRLITYKLRDGTEFIVSTIYDWGVRMLSPNGMYGATAQDTFTTGATQATAPDMLGAPSVTSLEGPVTA